MKTKYDWSSVPKEVKWIAVDSDLWAYGYSEEPELEELTFFSDSYTGYLLRPCDHSYEGAWRDSLEERPK